MIFRRLGYLACLIAVILALLSYDRWLPGLHSALDTREPQNREPLTLSHTYVLHEKEWLSFFLSPGSERMWLLTNANFPRSVVSAAVTSGRPDPGARYSLHYAFLDTRDEVIEEGEYHFRAPTPVQEQAGRPQRFYAVSGLTPAGGQSLRQNLTRKLERPCRIRLRVGSRDPRIYDVAVRLYCQNDIPDYALQHAWRRTSRRKRDKLAAASVYGAQLLTENERRNLIKRHWQPMAPSGMEGRDYSRRILYSRQDEQSLPPSGAAEPPAGLLVQPGHPGVIPLPEGSGRLQLRFATLEDADTRSESTVTLAWYGIRKSDRSRWQVRVTRESAVWEGPVSGGLLAAYVEQPLAVRSFWTGKQVSRDSALAATREITPEPAVVRSYLLGPNRAVDYEIAHVGSLPTPLRLVVRRMAPPEDAPDPGAWLPRPVRWSLRDGQGEVLENGQFSTDSEPLSHYDFASTDRGPTKISDPLTFHFAIPPGAATLRLESDDSLAGVCAFSKPPDVGRVLWEPEDRYVFHRREAGRRTWFVLRPRDHREKTNALQTVIVRTQPRPPEQAEIEQAEVEWRALEPLGNWRGRYLLTPAQSEPDAEWETWSSCFFELPVGQTHAVRLVADPGHRRVAPRVICHGPHPSEESVRVQVNGRLHQVLERRAATSLFSLLPIEMRDARRAPTRIRFQTDAAVRVFMNRQMSSPGTAYFRRLVSRLDSRPLTYVVEKKTEEDEYLALTLFQSAGSTAPRRRAQVQVRIDGSESLGTRVISPPNAAPTAHVRSYSLRLSDGPHAPVFAAAEPAAAVHHRTFVRLGADLPPGRYRIAITAQQPFRGYLLLTQKQPARPATRRRLAPEVASSNRSPALPAGKE